MAAVKQGCLERYAFDRSEATSPLPRRRVRETLGGREWNFEHLRKLKLIALLPAFLIICSVTPVFSQSPSPPPSTGFDEGEEIIIECKDFTTGEWSAGPICHETGKGLSVNVGINSFRYCGLEVSNQTFYNHLVALIKLESTWHCRMPMDKEHSFYVPFTIPIWGTVAKDHIRVNNRMNIVFHLSRGKIIGATAYPVRDRFQYGKLGSMISLHGSVMWFHHMGFQNEASLDAPSSDLGEDWLVALASATVSCLVTLLFAISLYIGRLKPNIMRRCLKKE